MKTLKDSALVKSQMRVDISLFVARLLSRIISSAVPKRETRIAVREKVLAYFKRKWLCPAQFECIIPVGKDCHTAHYLRTSGLRKASYPLDWMMNFSLDEVVDLFRRDFRNFFDGANEDGQTSNLIQDKDTHPQKNGPKERKAKCVYAKSGMTSSHHFPLEFSISEYLPTFQAIMVRRYKRLKETIKSAKRIALICARPCSVDELAHFGKQMSEIFCDEKWLDNVAKRERERERVATQILVCQKALHKSKFA